LRFGEPPRRPNKQGAAALTLGLFIVLMV